MFNYKIQYSELKVQINHLQPLYKWTMKKDKDIIELWYLPIYSRNIKISLLELFLLFSSAPFTAQFVVFIYLT